MKTTIMVGVTLFGLALVTDVTHAVDEGLHLDINANVGIGTSTPQDKLHVQDGNLLVKQTSEHAKLRFSAGAHLWEITQNLTTGRLVFHYPGGAAITGSFKFAPQAVENLLRVGVSAGDTVDINGKLVVNGSQVAPDYVFDSSYQLESIEDHSKYMWNNRHLPSLPSGGTDGKVPVDIVSHQMGMLEELEKAHIYIEKLHDSIKELKMMFENKSNELAELKTEVRMMQAKR